MQVSKKFKDKFPQSTINQFISLMSLKPTQAMVYALVACGFYFFAFWGAGSLISFLFGFPFWPCVGLVFFLRLCFT